ncbi:MAG: hypothetical protein KC483_00750 [Nitrosarchaeum sp.]|nr:hypothetical protein [Nitrosarchaeum sp.]
MGWLGLMLVGFGIIATVTLSECAYGQADSVYTNEQITLSDDLKNNPVAQDILRKIEQTKKWIEELEQREYEDLEKQKELEEKRNEALTKLNQDLADWEKLWEYYSPRNSFARFVENVSDPQTQDVFWDQFEFKEQKVKAGRDALKQVVANGGSLHDARQAYLIAAETKRIELIEANSQFNVRHNLAYYNQQILFDREGQFIDSPITGEQLRKYYEDFRTNPAYLAANPDDAVSWEELGKTNPKTECMEGEIVVYRFHANDYVCVTISTAELWIRHGMGEITGISNDVATSRYEQSVSPITRCDDGLVVVFVLESKKYSCIIEDTANTWVQDGIAEFHDPEDYILESIERKDAFVKIGEINQQIRDMEKQHENRKLELKQRYDVKYDEIQQEAKASEETTIKRFNDGNMSKEEMSKKIIDIREDLESDKEKILRDKVNDTKMLEREHEKRMSDFANDYEFNPYIQVTMNSGRTGYEATLRE